MNLLIDYYTFNQKRLSENKKNYIEMILIYMLNTHYTIYLDYDKNHNEAYKEIKIFDKNFKNKNIDLYNKSNSLGYVRAHRKFNFIFVKVFNKIFRKMYNLMYRLKHS